jgi:hypothetical protein
MGQRGLAAREVVRLARSLTKRRSISEQHVPAKSPRLRWVEGEALCVTRPVWREFEGIVPGRLRRAALTTVPKTVVETIRLPGLGRCRLTRFAPAVTWRRWLAALAGRPVRSPAIREAGLSFRRRRHGLPAPIVLAFGGRADGSGFLLTKDRPTRLIGTGPWS